MELETDGGMGITNIQLKKYSLSLSLYIYICKNNNNKKKNNKLLSSLSPLALFKQEWQLWV